MDIISSEEHNTLLPLLNLMEDIAFVVDHTLSPGMLPYLSWRAELLMAVTK